MKKYLEVLNDIYHASNANLGFTPFKLVVSNMICRDIQNELFGPTNSQYVFFNSAFIYSNMFIEADPIMPASQFAIIHEDPIKINTFHTLITTGSFIDLINEISYYDPSHQNQIFFKPVVQTNSLSQPTFQGLSHPRNNKSPIQETNIAAMKTTVCIHDWKNYTGFTEVYKYCSKCNEKDRS